MTFWDTALFALYLGGSFACFMLLKGRLAWAALICMSASVSIMAGAVALAPLDYAWLLALLIIVQVAARCWAALDPGLEPLPTNTGVRGTAAAFAGLLAAFFASSAMLKGVPAPVALAEAAPVMGVCIGFYTAIKFDWRAAPLFIGDYIQAVCGGAALGGLMSFTTVGEVSYATAWLPWACLFGIGMVHPAGAERVRGVVAGVVARRQVPETAKKEV